jgi:hypothetical protein
MAGLLYKIFIIENMVNLDRNQLIEAGVQFGNLARK